MENESKNHEVSSNEIEKAVGGHAALGEPCEKGLTRPSLYVCPGKGCEYYCANYPLLPDERVPFCAYFCVSVHD